MLLLLFHDAASGPSDSRDYHDRHRTAPKPVNAPAITPRALMLAFMMHEAARRRDTTPSKAPPNARYFPVIIGMISLGAEELPLYRTTPARHWSSAAAKPNDFRRHTAAHFLDDEKLAWPRRFSAFGLYL